MKHLMFDIDGTLVKSCDFDNVCYDEAVIDVVGKAAHPDRRQYTHVTDEGILRQHLSDLKIQEIDSAIQEIKIRFIKGITRHINKYGVTAIQGAVDFVNNIPERFPDISYSFATGGWRETALFKLNAAGFDTELFILASSDDHYARVNIMKMALMKSNLDESSTEISYFGDGSWDKQACKTLNWNFILVGNATDHSQNIDDFSDSQKITTWI